MPTSKQVDQAMLFPSPGNAAKVLVEAVEALRAEERRLRSLLNEAVRHQQFQSEQSCTVDMCPWMRDAKEILAGDGALAKEPERKFKIGDVVLSSDSRLLRVVGFRDENLNACNLYSSDIDFGTYYESELTLFSDLEVAA